MSDSRLTQAVDVDSYIEFCVSFLNTVKFEDWYELIWYSCEWMKIEIQINNEKENKQAHKRIQGKANVGKTMEHLNETANDSRKTLGQKQ